MDTAQAILLIAALDDLDFITRQWRIDNSHAAHWNLNDTNYFIVVQLFGTGSYASIIYWKVLRNDNIYKNISFEEILHSVPTSIQERLLFNLDLFR